jgi:rod shape-determining protein MreC
MKNILLFIRQYTILITFLALEIACIVMLMRFSKTHDAFFSQVSNEYGGSINKKVNTVTSYINLKEVNTQLALENNRLKDSLLKNFIVFDSTKFIVKDSIIKDTNNHFRKYQYLPAQVVYNSFTNQSNFLTLERGKNQGVKKDMSVVGPLGVVGRVVSVSDNYCLVMSLLNHNSVVNAMFKKSNFAVGSIEWDGKDPSYLVMNKVPKSSEVKKGDTVVTSNYSANYPSQLPIGFVTEIKPDAVGNNYILKVKTATNFYTLQHVNIIINYFYDEQKTLEENIKKLTSTN